MSKVTVINATAGSVHVQETGRAGPAGLVWRNEGWALDAHYQINQALGHNGSSYRVLAEHIATAQTEPGVGADWETVWQVLALGSGVEDVSIVAGIASEIVSVASIRDEVETVASIRDEVVTVGGVSAEVETVAARAADIGVVAARDADIGKVAAIDDDIGKVAPVTDDIRTLAPATGDVQVAVANLPSIQAAPQAAIDAGAARDASQGYAGTASASAGVATGAAAASKDARDKSAAWAESPEDVPVEPGKFSARHYAAKAGQAASTFDPQPIIDAAVRRSIALNIVFGG